MLRNLQVGLTACARMLAESENVLLKNALISAVSNIYKIDMSTAATKDFKSFDAFFTRDFKEDARPIADSTVIHPVDGKVVEFGQLSPEHDVYIKHKPYSHAELGLNPNSNYISYYLAPYNHHQIYMPIDGTIIQTTYVPGMLYSVKPVADQQNRVVNFKNERLIILIDSELGPITLVLVGALLVGSISTSWGQRYYPNKDQTISQSQVQQKFAKGESIGRFHYGSSVLLVADAPLGELNLDAQQNCLMGQAAWT